MAQQENPVPLFCFKHRIYADFVGGSDSYSQIFNRRADGRCESEDRNHDCCRLFVVTAAAGTISAVVKAGYEMDISRFRYSFISRMKEKIMRVRYEKLEDPKYLNEFWRVTSATSDIEFGVGILTQLFVLSANGISAVFYLSVLGKLNFLIVLLLIADIYIVYLLREKASKYEVEISRKASPFGRRQRYLTNVMGNLAYGKDLRIYGLSNLFAGEADA